MSIKVILSPYNPIPLVEDSLVVEPGINYVHPRKSAYIDSLEPNEIDNAYYLPIVRTDTITLQYKRGKAGTDIWNYAVLNFYDENGVFINYLTQPTAYYTLPGDVDEFGEQLYTEQFTFKPSELAYLAGHSLITIQLIIHFGDGTDINVGDTVFNLNSFCPLLLSDNHSGTCLIEYSNDHNSKFTVFEEPSIFPVFRLRVKSGRFKVIPSGEYTTYNDMSSKLSVLDGEAYNNYSLEIGPVPERLIDTLNYIMKCNNLRINGDEYVMEEDIAEPTGDGPLKWQVYKIRDRNEEDTFAFQNATFLLWERPVSSYNYGLSTVGITDGYNVFFKLSQIFENITAENNFVTALNVSAAAATSTGQCFEAGGKYYFRNGPGQRFRPIALPKVLPKEMIVTYSIANAPRIPNFAIYYADASQHVILFKDTTGSGDAVAFTNSGLVTSISKTYGSNGTISFRIFHNDEEIEYGMNTPGVYPKITNITGLASSQLAKFNFVNNNLSSHANFSLSFLAPAKSVLKHLIIRASQLNGLSANWAQSLLVGSIPNILKPFPFEMFDLRQNNLSTPDTDDIIIEFATYSAYKSGPYSFLIQGQSPAAPPTGASSAERLAMTNAGLNVMHD